MSIIGFELGPGFFFVLKKRKEKKERDGCNRKPYIGKTSK
jgi:hypothetical protein